MVLIKFEENLIKISKSNNWEQAIKEWGFLWKKERDNRDNHCLCGTKLKHQYYYYNKNTKKIICCGMECKKHIDSKNVGESLLVGFGDYTGGETSIYLDKEHVFDIQNNSLIFNGSEIEHRSLPFKGTRYSLVFFKT